MSDSALPAVKDGAAAVELFAPTQSILARFRRNKLSIFGAIIVAVAVAMALFAPWLSPLDPDAVDARSRLAPMGTAGHLLGTDELGRDILSRLIWGARVTLVVSLSATAIALIVGTLLGLLSGYFLGWLDSVIMRLIDILMAFPYFLLALAVIAVLGPGLLNGMIAVALVNIPFFTRIVRGVTLSIRESDYVTAARGIGAGNTRILLRHVLLNCVSTVIVAGTLNIGWMITAAAALSFLGLGVQPPTSDWGTMLSSGRQFLSAAPHVATLPGLAIFVTVLGFNLLGDGLRDALDPRLRE